MSIPKYSIHLTYVNEDGTAGFPEKFIKQIEAIVKKYFTNYEIAEEHGVNGTNRHFHCIFDCTRRIDKIRDLFKPLHPENPGLETPQRYYKRRIRCSINSFTLADSFTYFRKEIDSNSPYIDPTTGERPGITNSRSRILLSTFSPDVVKANLLLYSPHNSTSGNKFKLTEFFRTIPKQVSKVVLIHALDAYASKFYPGHDNCVTKIEFAEMIQRMTMEGYVIYYHIKSSTIHWLNAMRDDSEAIPHLIAIEDGVCPHCHKGIA